MDTEPLDLCLILALLCADTAKQAVATEGVGCGTGVAVKITNPFLFTFYCMFLLLPDLYASQAAGDERYASGTELRFHSWNTKRLKSRAPSGLFLLSERNQSRWGFQNVSRA